MKVEIYAQAVLAGILALTCAACGQPERPSPAPASANRGRGPALDPQAAAHRFWAAILTQCGDSYYEGVLGSGIRRYKQPSFPPAVPAPLTAADRAKGYRWRGSASLTGKALDEYHGQWYTWRDADRDARTSSSGRTIAAPGVALLKVSMWNRNGRWHFEPPRSSGAAPAWGVDLDPATIARSNDFPFPRVEPLDRKWTCAEIPGTEEHEAAGKELEAEAERIRNVGAQRDTVPVAEVRSVEHTGVEPRLVYRAPEPPFLQEARAGGRQGTVELRFVIDVDGRVKNVRVEKGVGARLDEKTVEWVRQWVYRPAMKYARPVPVEFRANIDVGRQP